VCGRGPAHTGGRRAGAGNNWPCLFSQLNLHACSNKIKLSHLMMSNLSSCKRRVSLLARRRANLLHFLCKQFGLLGLFMACAVGQLILGVGSLPNCTNFPFINFPTDFVLLEHNYLFCLTAGPSTKLCAGGRRMEEMSYGILRATACMDETDLHALGNAEKENFV
jgi:hypothetical protein